MDVIKNNESIDLFELNSNLTQVVELIEKEWIKRENIDFVKKVLISLINFYYNLIIDSFGKINFKDKNDLVLTLKNFSFQLRSFCVEKEYYRLTVNKNEKIIEWLDYWLWKIREQLKYLSGNISLKLIIYEMLGNQSGIYSIDPKWNLIYKLDNNDDFLLLIDNYIEKFEELLKEEIYDFNRRFIKLRIDFEKKIKNWKMNSLL